MTFLEWFRRDATALALLPRVEALEVRIAHLEEALNVPRVVDGPSNRVDQQLIRRRHTHPSSATGLTWAVSSSGVIVGDEETPSTSLGRPVTVPRIVRAHSQAIITAAERYSVPRSVIVATIATESGGNPGAHRNEPPLKDGTPRWSHGLMQVLNTTAADLTGMPLSKITRAWMSANSVDLGTRYIASQRNLTELDPPLVAIAYNSGGLYRVSKNSRFGKNRWGLRQYGQHADKWLTWYNDCFRSDIPNDIKAFFQSDTQLCSSHSQ